MDSREMELVEMLEARSLPVFNPLKGLSSPFPPCIDMDKKFQIWAAALKYLKQGRPGDVRILAGWWLMAMPCGHNKT